MKKTIYAAPATEQIEIRTEENFLNSLRSGASANMNNAHLYDGGEDQDW